jgi:hypothetical protein
MEGASAVVDRDRLAAACHHGTRHSVCHSSGSFAGFLHSQRTLLYYYVYKLVVVSLSWKQVPAFKHRALVREETSGFSLADKIRTHANNKHFHMRFPSVSSTFLLSNAKENKQ